MPKLKTVTRTTTTLYVGENEDIELELDHEPDSGDEPLVEELEGGGWVVGYLVRDDDAENPLDDCDGMGKIVDGRGRSRSSDAYRERRENFDQVFDVLLDVYSHSGDVWRVHGSGRYFPDEQWDVSQGAGIWYPDDCCRQQIEMIAAEELLEPREWHKVRRERAFSDANKKPLLPDRTVPLVNISAELHSEETGKFYQNGNPVSRYWNTYGFEIRDGKSRRGYKTILAATKGAAKALGIKFDKAKYDKECREEATVCAHQAVEAYNGWLSGDSWGVCVETFDKAGEPLEQDACWGWHGQEYAKEEIRSNMSLAAETAKEKRDGEAKSD